MAKSDWDGYMAIIGPPDAPEDECIKIPLHGEKQSNIQTKMNNAFRNALSLLNDTIDVSSNSKIILCSLSCELFLKAIILKTQDRTVWGHDIHELYFELRQEEQNHLLDAFAMRNLKPDEEINDSKINEIIDDFEKNLTLDACLFETIRYKHEYSGMFYNESFIYNFAHDLKMLGNALGFAE